MQRRLGFVENYFRIANDFGAFVTNRVYRISGSLDAELVARAVRSMQSRLPVLRSRIAGTKRASLEVLPVDQVPSPLVSIHRESSGQWKKEFEQNLHRKFEKDVCPLLRIIHLCPPGGQGEHELFFNCHHTLLDGMSITRLGNQLFQLCGRLQASNKSQLVPQLAVGPSLEARLKMRSFERTARFILQNIVLKKKFSRNLRFRTEQHLHVDRRRTRMEYLELGDELSQRIVHRAKKHRISIHGFFSACLLKAASRWADPERPLSLLTPVDLRWHCDSREEVPAADDYGCRAWSVTTIHHQVDEFTVSELANECSQLVKHNLAWSMPPDLKFSRSIRNWLNRHRNNPDMGRIYDLGITSPGIVPPEPSDGDFEFNSVFSTSAQHVVGATVQITVLTVKRQILLSIAFGVPVSPDERQEFVMWLKKIVSTSADAIT